MIHYTRGPPPLVPRKPPAFAQKLRGDTLLDGYSYDAIRALAGPQTDFYRQQYLKLVGVAEGLDQE